jgi:nitrogen fixation protein NifB
MLFLLPGVNDEHIMDIAKRVKEQGASLMNVIPLIPMHKFKDTLLDRDVLN